MTLSMLVPAARGLAVTLVVLGAVGCGGSPALLRQARALPSFNAGQSAFPDSLATAEIDAATWARLTSQPLAPLCDASRRASPDGATGEPPAAMAQQLDSGLANQVARVLEAASSAELDERDRLRAKPGGASIPEPLPGQVRSVSAACLPRPAVAVDGKVTHFELIYATVDVERPTNEVVLLGYSPSTGDIGALHVRVNPKMSPPPVNTFALSSVKQYAVPAVPPIVHREGDRTFRVFFAPPDARAGFYAIAPHDDDDGPDDILFGRFTVR
ncbi:MAG: hypothetical protein EOO66_04330 [Methylobacterium sp.]|nr:MAG: hypothetical protein EOO66_04330 [Methylobacterium sp.]